MLGIVLVINDVDDVYKHRRVVSSLASNDDVFLHPYRRLGKLGSSSNARMFYR